MTRVILIRHCEAEGNVKQIFQGRTDAPITENGRQQLELLALRLRNTKIDVLYSSPLVRAYETAVAVNQYHNLPILQEQGLMELDGGEWEGVPWTDLPEKFPEMAEIWWKTPHEFVSERGESMRRLRPHLGHRDAPDSGKSRQNDRCDQPRLRHPQFSLPRRGMAHRTAERNGLERQHRG